MPSILQTSFPRYLSVFSAWLEMKFQYSRSLLNYIAVSKTIDWFQKHHIKTVLLLFSCVSDYNTDLPQHVGEFWIRIAVKRWGLTKKYREVEN